MKRRDWALERMWPAVTPQIHHKRHDRFQQATEIKPQSLLVLHDTAGGTTGAGHAAIAARRRLEAPASLL